MRTQRLAGSLIVFFGVALALTPSFASFTPGRETLVMAHNTFTEKGKWTDRFNRALSSGMPLAMEFDLTWAPNPKTGKIGSLVGDFPERRFNEITGDEPQLKPYFFERVRPIVEKALKDNDKRNWPLIRLYLDIKNDPPENRTLSTTRLSLPINRRVLTTDAPRFGTLCALFQFMRGLSTLVEKCPTACRSNV